MGLSAAKRAVAPSGTLRQKGRGERLLVALQLFRDDASEEAAEVGAAARELVTHGVVLKKNAQSLPLECSVRGGKARYTGSLCLCSEPTRQRKKRESEQRLEVGNAWGRPQRNAQSLPLECSVRGGEARDTGSLCTCSGTTRRRTKRKSAQRLNIW